MKLFIICAVVFLLIGIFVCIFWGLKIEKQYLLNTQTNNFHLVEVYQSNARAPIFAALITIGSFLLTLKTAILQRLKEGFDTKNYTRRFLDYRVNEPQASYYASLKRLSNALASAIFLCFIASFLQMSLGFYAHSSAVLSCLFFAALALFVVMYLTTEIFLAHQEWFKKIEDDRMEQLKKNGDIQ